VRGLPDGITTCLFDLDAVLTPTAKIHATAWKRMFDEFLRTWYSRTDRPFQEFVLPDDYEEYVDGKPRRDGVRSFLQSRGIDSPLGLAGVQAGRVGQFGWVIGVDRTGDGRALHAHGADDVVEDLAELVERP
jgi:beta-phosphoglucomutase-like phosphatase (HAD superfamily)